MSQQTGNPSAKELIKQLQEFMQRCESMLDDNIEPDLTGMDKQVEALQGTIHELQFDELQNLQPVLQSLMERLLELENKLKAQRDKVKNSLQGIAQKKQAHSAYQRMQGTPDASQSGSDGEGHKE